MTETKFLHPRIMNLLKSIASYAQEGFTGKLEIQVSNQEKIALYLNLGFLGWAYDGTVSYQRKTRHLLSLDISQDIVEALIDIEKRKRESCDYQVACEYDTLVEVARNNLLSKTQVSNLISNLSQELLFDLIHKLQQQGRTNSSEQVVIKAYSGERPSDSSLMPHTWQCSLDEVIKKTETDYQQWLKLGLGNYSLNVAPTIRSKQLLSEETSSKTYNNLVFLLDGKRSLREIAAKLKQNPITIAQSLLPYLKKGIISLESAYKIQKKSKSASVRSSLKVVAIDDSPQSLGIIEKIVTGEGDQFTGINNPVVALQTLLEQTPDLIILDLVMPFINGYELCSKIRQVERLQNVPIVLLTGNFIDQVRAKLVGANQCVEKPIPTEKIQEILGFYHGKKQKALKKSRLTAQVGWNVSQPQLEG